MGFTINTYKNIDLMLKAPRQTGITDWKGLTADPTVAYGQQALNDLGSHDNRGRPLKVDGKAGKLTQQSVLNFQEACAIATSGELDDMTWFHLDWRVYGELNGNWKPAKSTLTNTKSGGPAIQNGNNLFLDPVTPVNQNGMTREGLRSSDVREAFLGRSLGYEGAVLRAARGEELAAFLVGLSDHATGTADDDKGDLNLDRIIDFTEVETTFNLVQYMFMRSQRGPGYHDYYMTLKAGKQSVTKDRGWRGMDGAAIFVIGNYLRGNGQLMFPGYLNRKDVSWTAKRNTWKQLNQTVHTFPFHFHCTVALGMPQGSPF